MACFRIPAIIQTSSGVLLAFAEGRLGRCADCVVTGIVQKRSLDGGRTWGEMTWPVPPTPTGDGVWMDHGANPTAVFDAVNNQTLLHFVRGGDGNDCGECVRRPRLRPRLRLDPGPNRDPNPITNPNPNSD